MALDTSNIQLPDPGDPPAQKLKRLRQLITAEGDLSSLHGLYAVELTMAGQFEKAQRAWYAVIKRLGGKVMGEPLPREYQPSARLIGRRDYLVPPWRQPNRALPAASVIRLLAPGDPMTVLACEAREWPDDPMLGLHYAIAVMDGGNLVEAIEEFERVVALDPSMPQAQRLLGDLRKMRSQDELALAAWQAAWEAGDQDPLLAFSIAEICEDLGETIEALHWYRLAADADSIRAEPFFRLGRCLETVNDIDGAVKALKECLRRAPRFDEARLRLIPLLFGTGYVVDAIMEQRDYLSRHPDDTDGYLRLASWLGEVGQHRAAVRAYREVILARPEDADAHFGCAISLQALGLLQHALEEYKLAARYAPGKPGPNNNLANVLLRLGKPDRAVGIYRELLSVRPDDPETRFNLSVALMALDDPDGVEKELDRVLEIEPAHRQAAYNLGTLLMEQHRWADAVAKLELGVEHNPDDVPLRNNLATALERKGDREAALKQYAEVLRRDPLHQQTLFNRAATLFNLSRYDEAVEAYEKLLEVAPDHPVAAVNLKQARRVAELSKLTPLRRLLRLMS